MFLLTHLTLTLLSFSTLTTAWIIYIYDDNKCQDNYFPTLSDHPNAFGEVGVGSTCIAQGGNSWGISENSGCTFSAWSGADCRGSSTSPVSGPDCQSKPFGSVLADCP